MLYFVINGNQSQNFSHKKIQEGDRALDLYTATVILTIALLLVSIVDIYTSRMIGSSMKRNCIIVCVLIACSLFFEWAGVKTNGADPALIPLHKAVKLLEFCLAPLTCAMAAMSYSKLRFPRLVAALTTVHVIFEIIALRYGLVISIDDANIYHRGVLYPVYIAVFTLSILYCFASIMYDEMRHYRRPTSAVIAILLFLILGIGMQMMFSEVRVDYMCIAIGNYFVYNHRCKMILQLDGLTYLLNRRCYEKDVERIEAPTMIISMDVNKFKKVNDTYGHATGDYYLKTVASLISVVYSRYGSCYRCGGDEFCILLKKSIDRTEELNRQFENKIREKQRTDPKFPDVSVGFALFGSADEPIQEAFARADEMMYAAKRQTAK